MNDAQSKKKTGKAAASKKAASGQSNKKSAKTKPASSDKSDKAKGKTAEAVETAPANKVFRVDAKGGPIRLVKRSDAIQDIIAAGAFTEELVNSMFDKGSVAPSNDYNYSTNKAKLSKWEKEAEPESKPLEIGDVVFSSERNAFGDVRDKDGEPRIFFLLDGKLKSVAVTAKWGRATEDQAAEYRKTQALEKAEPIQGEVVVEDPPLTKEEKKELVEREAAISETMAAVENLPMILGENLDAIRTKKLFRESLNAAGEKFKTFGEYVTERFGITRSYAQNLAQLSGYHSIAVEALPAKLRDEGLSVNSTNALVRATNRLTEKLGLDEIDGFDELKPMIVGTIKILGDVAPKDERTGRPQITPRLVSSVTEVITQIAESGTVEIEGKQMSISDAADKGLLGAATQDQVLQVVAEGIKSNRQTIAEEAKGAYERSIEPKKTGPKPGANVFFSGTVPTLDLSCERHGSTKVINIGTGTFQTKCKCRWRIDAESGLLVCFEVNGKRVKPADK